TLCDPIPLRRGVYPSRCLLVSASPDSTIAAISPRNGHGVLARRRTTGAATAPPRGSRRHRPVCAALPTPALDGTPNGKANRDPYDGGVRDLDLARGPPARPPRVRAGHGGILDGCVQRH